MLTSSPAIGDKNPGRALEQAATSSPYSFLQIALLPKLLRAFSTATSTFILSYPGQVASTDLHRWFQLSMMIPGFQSYTSPPGTKSKLLLLFGEIDQVCLNGLQRLMNSWHSKHSRNHNKRLQICKWQSSPGNEKEFYSNRSFQFQYQP